MFIDCDSHLTEPADLWTTRVSSKWGDLIPHVRYVDDEQTQKFTFLRGKGIELWFTGDNPIAPAGLTAGGRWSEPLPSHPPTLADVIPGSFDAKARLADMDDMGIAAQVIYPNVAGLGSQQFRDLPPELSLECVHAYNDFLIEWREPAPRRFIPAAAIPYWDVKEAANEVRRVADLGFRAMVFPGAPHDWQQPFLASHHWDPLWEAAQESHVSVSFHAASGNFMGRLSQDQIDVEGFQASWTRASTQILFDTADQVADLLMSGILPRFPELTFVSVESGCGWVPFMLESLDNVFKQVRVNQYRPEFEGLPSDYFHRQVKICYWFEDDAVRLFDTIGVDNVLFETDYPHPLCLSPEEVRIAIDGRLGALKKEDRDKILFRNAMALYGLDPAILVDSGSG